MSRLILVAVMVQSIALLANAGFVTDNGLLRVQGTKFVNEAGSPVHLRGMSLFWSQWSGQFWNADVVKSLVDDWKITLIRAAMGVDKDDGWKGQPDVEEARVETIVDAAIANDIYVLVDWHSHDTMEEEAKGFFTRMATKYGSTPNILWEVFNEPIHQTWSGELKPYHTNLVNTIRPLSQNIIILGTRFYSSYPDEAANDPVPGENLAYTMHFYAATHYNDYIDRVRSAINSGKAVFITEWGVCEATGNGGLDTGNAQTWLNFLAENHIGDANWALNDKPEACSALKPGASTTGGWLPDRDLTESGQFVYNSLRAYGGVGSSTGSTGTGGCVSDTENCQSSGCCSNSALTCYEKDTTWAGCKSSCTPGIDFNDPPEYQTPWTCTVVSGSSSSSGSTSATNSNTCSPSGENCAATGCCNEGGMTCFEKDNAWAQCKASCTPGIDPSDPPEYQTSWSCTALGDKTPDDSDSLVSSATPVSLWAGAAVVSLSAVLSCRL